MRWNGGVLKHFRTPNSELVVDSLVMLVCCVSEVDERGSGFVTRGDLGGL